MNSNSAEIPPSAGGAESGDPFYAYKRSPSGPRCEFALRSEAIEWRAGWGGGRIAYADVRRMRLSLTTVKLATDRFVAEIWPALGGKIVIASTSWKSMAEQEPLDQAYGAFIGELHRRLLAAGSTATFEAGLPRWRYWPGLAVFVATSLVIAALTVLALNSGENAGALFVAVFLVFYLWRFGTYFRRNRPRTYRVDAPPSWLMPRPARAA